jgi:membrane-associated protease RseP (regulator of RpoE activity)
MPDDSPPPLEYQLYDPDRQEIRVVVIHPPKRRYWLHILLFLLTVLSTMCIGARLQYDFSNNLAAFGSGEDYFPWLWALRDWHRLAMGVPFSFCLLGILTAHELGHYLLCVRRKVYATWPYFIPAPTLIGTFGAFIRIRSPIRSRIDLFDIGIAGPIAGFVVAVPVLFLGLLASKPLTPLTANPDFVLGIPSIFNLVHWILAAAGSKAAAAQFAPVHLDLHPIAVAAWAGMLATSLNLLPGGQLDGGHIIFGVSPRLHRPLSYISIVVLLPLSWFYWAGWLLWAIVLRLTIRHPQVPLSGDLDVKRKLLAIFALLMLVLSFIPKPISNNEGTGIREMIHSNQSSK